MAADRRACRLALPGGAALKLAISHRYDFGSERALVGAELAGAAAWDALRLGSGPFSLPETRAEWEALADADRIAEARARALAALLDRRGVQTLASYGAGAAVPELWLARLAPGRRLVVTEFAPATVERLAALFPEAEVRRHDLLADPPVAQADLHLFHRIDTELDDVSFRAVLARFRAVPVVVVATELLSARAVLRELRTRLRPGVTRAGLVRSRGAFESLWRDTHDGIPLRVHDLHGWLLEPR